MKSRVSAAAGSGVYTNDQRSRVIYRRSREMVKAKISAMLLISTALPHGVFSQSTGPQTSFEAASIRLSADAARRATIGPSPGGVRFMARNMPLLWLIASAYGVSIRQVSGLPSSFSSKNYDIEAKSAAPTSRQGMMKMLRTLIENRFNLGLHRQAKKLRVYALTVAKGGPRLVENKDGADLEARNSGAGREIYRNFPMPIFANILSAHVEDIVVDKTGLTGSYDFKLEFTPERLGQGANDGHEPAPNLDGPSLFTALEEQLGLELKRETLPVEFLVIDRIEGPSEN
jgi:uncharacterized protein (TIGR03435 family)